MTSTSGVMQSLRTILARRHALRSTFDVSSSLAALEESCIPSYVHPNMLASAVAWLRLLTATRLFKKYSKTGPILDFGSSSGELFHLLRTHEPYYFIEADDKLACALQGWNPDARRISPETLPADRFAAIFALDALEHNENIAYLTDKLVQSLLPEGILVLSGPTENLLYRLGRRVAGFDGHYHLVTIFAIEAQVQDSLVLQERRNVPFGLPLFRISVWSRSPCMSVNDTH